MYNFIFFILQIFYINEYLAMAEAMAKLIASEQSLYRRSPIPWQRARAEAEIRAAEEAVRMAAARADDERENFHIQAV